jgi:hypothetical protein
LAICLEGKGRERDDKKNGKKIASIIHRKVDG